MKLYTNTDLSLIKNNIKDINKKVRSVIMNNFNPNFNERQQIFSIILDYIKDNNRKIYGGYALNELIKQKNDNDIIYYIDELPDIDFYSYDPNTDIINICNKIYESGFLKVNGREAKHKNTYSIFVNYELFCDITYVPKYIFDKIPFKTINNIRYVDPRFMLIDYLKILSDPLCSNWRIEKTYERLILLNKYYPIYENKESIIINPIDNQDILDNCIELIYDLIKNKNDIIVIGFYAYNYFLLKSKFNKLDLVDIPYIELISKNYRDDFYNIYNKLKDSFTNLEISYKEYYPFFIYNGYRVEIYVENELILILYDYDNRCLPYQKVNFIDYNKNIEYSDIKINIGTFNLSLLYAQINVIKHNIFKDVNMKIIYEKFVSHLILIREFYFRRNKLNLLDDTIFRDFITDCIYPEFNPEHENLIRYEKRKENNKPSMYIYDPNKNKKDEKANNFYFSNISGNEIKNKKHSKIFNTQNDNIESSDNLDDNENNIVVDGNVDDVDVINDVIVDDNID